MDFHRLRSQADYDAAYAQSITDPERFWAAQAERFTWRRRWDRVLRWDFQGPDVKWFIGGKLNITENCLDRHLAARGDKTAIQWEPNDPNEAVQRITYRELHERVCRYANVLKRNGVGKGDRVCIYMPMIPELAVAVLACARIGAVHSVVFAGFSNVFAAVLTGSRHRRCQPAAPENAHSALGRSLRSPRACAFGQRP